VVLASRVTPNPETTEVDTLLPLVAWVDQFKEKVLGSLGNPVLLESCTWYSVLIAPPSPTLGLVFLSQAKVNEVLKTLLKGLPAFAGVAARV
jgi:hypothetical protein